MPESKENIVRVTLEEARKMRGKTDYARLDALTDEDIARACESDPDAVPVNADWSQARWIIPSAQQPRWLKVDEDVVVWFQRAGEGYRERMRAVLRAYMETHGETEAEPEGACRGSITSP